MTRNIRFIFALALLAACVGSPGASSVSTEQRDCLALTLYWEARTEGRDGMVGVGWVVLNRVAHAAYPDNVCAVVRQGGEKPGCQFSYWCDGKSDVPRDEAQWELARDVAEELLSDPPPDPTHGALFFHADYATDSQWFAGRQRTVKIGPHLYYR